MKFTRVNKDTINCIITEDDMDEQGLKLEDLFDKSKEAMDFLHDVMEKAVEEVDYKPQGAFTPMQITVLPDHSISLTLSENHGGIIHNRGVVSDTGFGDGSYSLFIATNHADKIVAASIIFFDDSDLEEC